MATPVQILTTQQASLLGIARTILNEVEKQAVKQGHDSDAKDSHLVISCGRVAEACDIAEYAIFNVLNLLSSHLHDPVAAAEIDSPS